MRAALGVSTASRDEARAEVVMMRDTTTPEYLAAVDHLADSSHRHDVALGDYEATPEGQKMLERVITRLQADGDQAGAGAAQDRLDSARARRLDQIADLGTSRAYTHRLAEPTEAESAALNQAAAEVAGADGDVAAAGYRVSAAEDALTEHQPAYRAAINEHDRNQAIVNKSEQDIAAGTLASRQAALRLYRDAGVSPGLAACYADDMVESARGAERHDRYGNDIPSRDVPTARPLQMKIKRPGTPDHERTVTAKDSARTDPAFNEASTSLNEALHTRRTAMAALDDSTAYADALDKNSRLLRGLRQAGMAREDAQNAHAKAEDAARLVRAKISAGVGVDSRSVALSTVSDDVVRNPDGSTNAHVYEPASPGFQNGRLRPVVAASRITPDGAANTLVLDNGRKLIATREWSQAVGRDVTLSPTIILTPPQPGSSPLRAEASAGAGYLAYRRDTSD